MEPELELGFFDIIKDFNQMVIKHLIIGRRAVVLYGAPVLTADYDFWIDAADRDRVLSYFIEKGCTLSEPEDSVKPMIEAPCSKLQGIFDCKEFYQFFDSLANPAACCGVSARCAVQVYAGPRKIDLFFHKKIKNVEGDLIEFESCYQNATTKEDPEQGLFFCIPSIDDLIKTKKIRKENIKDLQDIEYLLKTKDMSKS